MPDSTQPPMSGDLLDAVFGALSHASRRQMLAILVARGGVMTAGEIADRFKHSWPTTTRHLGVLEKANVVRVERVGRRRNYTLNREALVGAARWVGSIMGTPPEVFGAGYPEGWARLPYAKMRNAHPPEPPPEPSREPGDRGP